MKQISFSSLRGLYTKLVKTEYLIIIRQIRMIVTGNSFGLGAPARLTLPRTKVDAEVDRNPGT